MLSLPWSMDAGLGRLILRLTAALVLAVPASAQIKTTEAEPDQLICLELEGPSAVLVQRPLDLDYKPLRLDGGKMVVVFCTHNHRQIVITTFRNGPEIPIVTQHVINVRRNPDEPDDPPDEPDEPDDPPDDPELKGIAAEVLRLGRETNFPRAVAQKFAKNFEVASTKLSAVRSYTIEQAAADIIKANLRDSSPKKIPKSAQRLEDQLKRYLRDLGQDRARVIQALSDIAEGFRAI